jgi:hypothetical protein
MGAPGVAAVIIRREKDLVAHFQRAGAVDRASAMTPSALGVEEQFAWERLVSRGVICVGAPGTFYLDEAAWAALRSMRRRMAVVLLLLVVAGGLIPILLTRR